jgi:hypothetical protein
MLGTSAIAAEDREVSIINNRLLFMMMSSVRIRVCCPSVFVQR